MGMVGLTPVSHVVIYDDKSGANAAARLWWMLKAVGHEKAQVIDGGWETIQKSGLPFSVCIIKPKSTAHYPVQEWLLPTVSMSDVERLVKDRHHVVIDVRESYRYKGESEPIDLVAGHIPGAVNVPYLDNLDSRGNFKSAEELAALYQSLIGDRKPEHVIVHCGSGVTACHTLLALDQAGIRGTSLYVGSWSEWSRNDKPIGKE